MPYEGQRCFLTTVWLIGVYCTRCALCIAHSKGHWLSGSLLWDSKSISKFWGGGPNFHAFNESRQPCIGTCKINIIFICAAQRSQQKALFAM